MSTENENKAGQQRKAAGKFIAPFTVECADSRNRTIMLNSIPLAPLRGRWSISSYNGKEGGQHPGTPLQSMPDVPGLHIEVRPAEKKVRIYDPLEQNAALLAEINRVADQSVSIKPSDGKFTPVEATVIDLNEDQIKTLMLEIARRVYGKYPEMRPVLGSKVPTEADLEGFAGDELFDPRSNSVDKPLHLKDYDAWLGRIHRPATPVY